MVNYSGQQTQRILDATAGYRSMWFDAHKPGVIFCDIRPEVSPDILCDIKSLPFKDECFDLIVFDPPHHGTGQHSWLVDQYGHFTNADIRVLLNAVFAEFHRVIKPSGYLMFKWATHDIKLSDALRFATQHFEPLFGNKVSMRSKHASTTYWVCLRPYYSSCQGQSAIKQGPGVRRNSSAAELPLSD